MWFYSMTFQSCWCFLHEVHVCDDCSVVQHVPGFGRSDPTCNSYNSYISSDSFNNMIIIRVLGGSPQRNTTVWETLEADQWKFTKPLLWTATETPSMLCFQEVQLSSRLQPHSAAVVETRQTAAERTHRPAAGSHVVCYRWSYWCVFLMLAPPACLSVCTSMLAGVSRCVVTVIPM